MGWINQPPGNTDLKIRTSSDGGVTFTPETMVASVVVPPDPLPGYTFECLTYPSLAADISNAPTTRGNVYAVWQDFREGYSDIFLATSTNFGVDWGHQYPLQVVRWAPKTFPAITVSPADGAIFVTYYTNRVNPLNLDVYLATSRDGGMTFTNTRITTTSFDVTGIPLIGDYIGNAIVPQTGRLVSVWTDTRTNTENIWFGDNQ